MVFARYSPEPRVIELAVCLFGTTEDLLCFEVEYPYQSWERLSCDALGMMQCGSRWEDSTATRHAFQEHFDSMLCRTRSLHPWVREAHLSWFWLWSISTNVV
jgi:hypothetical protein